MVPIVTRQNNKTALCEKELLIGARVELIVLECGEGKEEEEGMRMLGRRETSV